MAQILGIEYSKATAALEEFRTEGQTERSAALKSKLDAAVKDGKLSQGDADAVTNATEKGVNGRR